MPSSSSPLGKIQVNPSSSAPSMLSACAQTGARSDRVSGGDPGDQGDRDAPHWNSQVHRSKIADSGAAASRVAAAATNPR